MTSSPDISIRQLTEDDLDALLRIRQVAFLDDLSATDPKIRRTHVDLLDYKYGRFVEGDLVSSASWYPFSMHLGGEAAQVGGLASVVSAAETRRRGHVSALLMHGLQELRDAGIGWCLEHPFDTRYYRRFGWETIANGLTYEVPVERFGRFSAPSEARRVDANDAQALSRIRDIYGRWASDYNFTMTRDGRIWDDWKRVLTGAPWDDETRFIYLLDDAYCVVKLRETSDEQTLYLLDYAFGRPAGRRDVLGLIANFTGQVDTVGLQLASGDPLALEWSNFAVSHPHPLQARIVDVERALSGWPTSGIDCVIEVRDDFCAWNDGRFRLRSTNGSTHVTPTDESVDIGVDIRSLARILSGSVRPLAAQKAGLIDGDPQDISQVCSLAKRPSYLPLSDYF